MARSTRTATASNSQPRKESTISATSQSPQPRNTPSIPPLAEDAAVSAPGIYTNTTPIPRPISFVSSPLPHPRARNGPSPPSPPCFDHVSTLSSPVLQLDEMAAKALNRHNNPSDGAKILPTLPAEITCQCPLPLVGKFPSPSEPPPRRGEISPVCAVACC